MRSIKKNILSIKANSINNYKLKPMKIHDFINFYWAGPNNKMQASNFY